MALIGFLLIKSSPLVLTYKLEGLSLGCRYLEEIIAFTSAQQFFYIRIIWCKKLVKATKYKKNPHDFIHADLGVVSRAIMGCSNSNRNPLSFKPVLLFFGFNLIIYKF
jgi:hypothetical protein